MALGGLRNKVQSAKLIASGKDVKFEQDDFRVRFIGSARESAGRSRHDDRD